MKVRNKFFRLQGPEDDTPSVGGSGEEVVGTGNDARVALLESINDRNDVERADELALVNDDDTTEPFVAPSTDPEEEEPPAQADSEGGEVDVATPPAPQPLPKIKVNGEEIELTPDLIAKAQKIASADKYLADAKHPPAPEVPPKAQPSPEDVEREQVERDRRLVRAIQVGSEEEAIAALREVRESARPSMTLDDVGRIADERLSFKSALSWFNEEYSDLANDPQMKAIVEDRDEALVKAGDKRSYKERFDAVGKEVRAWRDGLVAKYAPKPAPVQELKDKEARKAAAPRVPPVASSTAKPPPEPDDKEESPSAVINAMAKARGGPQWMRQ